MRQRVLKRRPVAGFSMVELLVAVLVMGIGVLGVTGLQMVSLQNNRAALVRSDAVQLAYDMMDRIRANPTGAYGGLAIGDEPPNPPAGYCTSASCSTEQMVALDQAVWKCTLGSYHENGVCETLFAEGLLAAAPQGDRQQPGLPNGDGGVSVDGASGVVTITVQWAEANGTTGNITVDSRE